MASVNKVILVGNLGKDPESRYLPDGGAVCNFSIATTDKWKDKSGEKQEKTEWHNLTFYRGLAEVAGKYLKKGSMIYVEGKLATRKWQDKEGKDRYTTDIIVNEMQMLGSKGDSQQAESAQPAEAKPVPAKGGGVGWDGLDSDIPF